MDKRLQEIIDNFDRLKIGVDDKFHFHCTMCGKCCINREDILLNPKDLYNISKELGLKPIDTIKQYCETYIGNDSRFPIVRLKPKGSIKRCPFLKNRKCSVHKAKPTVCAMFPIGRVVSYAEDKKNALNLPMAEVNYIFMNPGCGDDSETHTVREWLSDFDIPSEDEYFMKWQSHLAEFSEFIRGLEKKKKQAQNSLGTVWNIIFVCAYCNYEIEKEFMPQFDRNMEDLQKILEPFGFKRRQSE